MIHPTADMMVAAGHEVIDRQGYGCTAGTKHA
jgi:hypothetical protein